MIAACRSVAPGEQIVTPKFRSSESSARDKKGKMKKGYETRIAVGVNQA
jgi:hypothetical protein